MRKWEYLELEGIEVALMNALGERGWELMRSTYSESYKHDPFARSTYLFKRERGPGHDAEPWQKTIDDYDFGRGYPTSPVWDAVYHLSVPQDSISEAVMNAVRAERENGCHWMGGGVVSGGQAFLPMLYRARDEASAARDTESLAIIDNALREVRDRYGAESCALATRYLRDKTHSIMWNEAMEALHGGRP